MDQEGRVLLCAWTDVRPWQPRAIAKGAWLFFDPLSTG